MILTFINIASCYYSIYKYAKYFAKRHPKVIEDEKAVAVVLKLEEDSYSDDGKSIGEEKRFSFDTANIPARKFTVTAVGPGWTPPDHEHDQAECAKGTDVVDFATQAAPVIEFDPSTKPGHRISLTGRTSPTTGAPKRPFSWQRMTSHTSSDSHHSPLDEGNPFQFPTSSPEVDGAERTFDGDNVGPTERNASVSRASPIPRPPFAHTSSVPTNSSASILRSAYDPGLGSLNTSSQWPLAKKQPDIDYYITTLANNSDSKRASHHSDGSSNRLYITEDDEGKKGYMKR